jgi:hypothetical protein
MSCCRFLALAILVGAGGAACGPPPHDQPDGAAAPDGAATPDGEVPFFGAVYANSYFNLYAVNPDTLDVTLVGPFGWPRGDDMMTDIAVDKDSHVWGISWGALYSVDPETAACTFVTVLSGQQFNGLTFLPAGVLDDTGEEALVATGLAGALYRIDITTGESTLIGDMGGNMESSGDIVSVVGFGTAATVKNGSTDDYLARIDPVTGVGTIIGNTHYPDIWGIGFWRNKVFGFVATNQFVLIDIDTGDAEYISTGPENWTGAGVTTTAPFIP